MLIESKIFFPRFWKTYQYKALEVSTVEWQKVKISQQI